MMLASIFFSRSSCLENGTACEIALRQFFRESISVSIVVIVFLSYLYFTILPLARQAQSGNFQEIYPLDFAQASIAFHRGTLMKYGRTSSVPSRNSGLVGRFVLY